GGRRPPPRPRGGGGGGGRPHMAQAGVADPSRLDEALAAGESVVRELSGRGDRT
ncbi:MAG: hypothetical protein F4X13_04910, partial [Gammaproteobacteria bacterium]|nr:hypothetical protein [Gammaproteobacteria bacterium]